MKTAEQTVENEKTETGNGSGDVVAWKAASVFFFFPSPDLRTVPGVLLPPPGVPVAPVPDFFVSRLLKKLASTPSLV